MRKSYILAACIAIAAAVWVLTGVFAERSEEEPAAAQAGAQGEQAAQSSHARIAKVRIIESAAQNHERSLVVQGRTEAKRKVMIRAEAAGQVSELSAEKGAIVADSSVLLRISVDERQAQLAEAKALVRQRQLEFAAAEKLQKKGYRADTQVAANAAALDAARAMVKRMQVELNKTVVAAPFEAVVEQRFVELGSYVSIGDDLFELIDQDPFLVIAQVAENSMTGLQVGGQARAQLVTGESVIGTISFLGTAADPQTRTFRVEVEIANPEGKIRDGMTAQLLLPTQTVRAHFLSPAVLTLDDSGRIGVRSVDDEDHVQFFEIEVVHDEVDGVWVKGLPEKARIISVGQEYVRDGDKVVTMPHTAAAPGDSNS